MSTEILRSPAQTRVVTILFVDLSGSSAHLNATDAETHLAAVQGFVSIVRQNVERCGGHVIQYLGDGAMCFFGDDRGSEDDASRAVHAALDLLAEWDQLPVGQTMRARCGVASGVIYFSAGDMSATVPATGPAINLASRLQDLAEDDQVLLCSRTHALIRGGISCRLAGHFPIHGFSRREPVFIAAARGEIRLPPSFGRKDKWPIVGRAPIIDAVTPIWRRVLAGRGQGCLFHGGAGVGKSRLVRELVHDFGTGNVIFWQCVADQQTTPFFPVRSYLEWVAAVPGGTPEPQRREAISELLGAHWNLEAEVRDNVLDSLFRSVLRQDGSSESSAASRRKEAIHTLADQVVTMAHNRGGLILAIEDWHWADPSLRDLVQVLLQRIENEPVLILLTSREADAGLAQTNLTAFQVAPVTPEDCRSIIAGIAGKDRLGKPAIDAIAAMSAGFPLFLEELTAQAIAEDGEGFSPSLPLTLATILQSRFDRLSGPCRQFLRMAAVQGQYFAPLVVARALDMAPEDWPAFAQELCDTDMVEIDAAPDAPQGRFSHALIQETIIHISAPPEIRALNLRLAEVYAAGDAMAEPQVVAQHYARARRPDMAIPEYLRAAGQQLMHGALVEAQAHLHKAESLLGALTDEGLRREREREICALLGPTHMITGGPGSRAFGEIQSRAFRLLAEENRGAERLSILYNEALHHWATARYGRAGVIVDIIRDSAGGAEGDIAHLAGNAMQGLIAWHMGLTERAERAFAEVHARYDIDRHRQLHLLFLKDLGVFCGFYAALTAAVRGDRATARLRAAKAAAAGAEAASMHDRGFGNLAQFNAAFLLGDLEEARGYAEKAAAFSERHGFPEFLAMAEFVLGWCSVAGGYARRGQAQMERAMNDWQATNFRSWLPLFGAYHSEALRRCNRAEEAEATARQWFERSEWTGERIALAPLLIARARASETMLSGSGRDLAARALRVARAQKAQLWCRAGLLEV